jgi:hypothetical protein
VQITYPPDAAGQGFMTLEDGAVAFPFDEDGCVDITRTVTFTDGIEEAPIVDEDLMSFTIRLGDEELCVYKPAVQRLIDIFI